VSSTRAGRHGRRHGRRHMGTQPDAGSTLCRKASTVGLSLRRWEQGGGSKEGGALTGKR
jgi:hypothetical protein